MHRNVKRVIIVSVVAIIGGLGYYLVSPLFLNTIVNESSPVQLVRDNQVDLPEEALGNDIVGILISGSFVGADDFHSSSGEALLVRSDSGELFLRFENFEVRVDTGCRIEATRTEVDALFVGTVGKLGEGETLIGARVSKTTPSSKRTDSVDSCRPPSGSANSRAASSASRSLMVAHARIAVSYGGAWQT